jgi:hypothetical protein
MRGRNKYVPSEVIGILGNIKKRNGFSRDVEAWDEMAKLTQIGSNVDDFYSSIFGNPKKMRRR